MHACACVRARENPIPRNPLRGWNAPPLPFRACGCVTAVESFLFLKNPWAHSSRSSRKTLGEHKLHLYQLNVLGPPCESRTPTLSEALRLSSPSDRRASDEWAVYASILLALCLLLQVAGFAGHSLVVVLVSAGVSFAATALVQGGPPNVRLGNAAIFTIMMTLLGYLLSFVIRP